MSLGAFIGGALGLGGSIWAGEQNRKAASAAQARQIAFEKEKAANYHQWEVADLKAAGLNPILSATHGTPLGNVGAPFGVQENPGEAAVHGASAFAQMRIARRQMDMQEKVAASQVDANSAQAFKANKEAEYIDEDIKSGRLAATVESLLSSAQQSREAAHNLVKQRSLIDQELSYNIQRLKNLKAEFQKIEADTRGSISSAAYNNSAAALRRQETKVAEQLERKYTYDAAISRLDFHKRSSTGRYYGGSTWAEVASGLVSAGYDGLTELGRITSRFMSAGPSDGSKLRNIGPLHDRR